MEFIVITAPDFLAGEIEALLSLQESGAFALHIRKATENQEDVRRFLRQLPLACQQLCVLHRFHELAMEFPVKGLHFNRFQRYSPTLPYPPHLTLSQSFHTWEEIQSVNKSLNYGFISPIFQGISKENYSPTWDFGKLKDFLWQSDFPFFALGGVMPQHLSTVEQLGFKGAAVLGYLWEDFRQNSDLKQFISKINVLQKNL